MCQKKVSSQKFSLRSHIKRLNHQHKKKIALDSKGSAQPSEKLQSLADPIGQPNPDGNDHSTTLKLKVPGL
jgi:hypothetical protein